MLERFVILFMAATARDLSSGIFEPNERRPKPELRMKIENLQRVMLRPEEGVRTTPSLEHVIPALRAPGHRLPAPGREIAPLQKTVGRQLELSLARSFGIDLET